MQTRWLITACATALLAFTSVAAVPQGDQNRGGDRNHGQSKKQHRQFKPEQQEAARTYYKQHQNEEVFRPNSRWNDDYENRLQSGYVLDDDMRRMSRPAPIELTRGLGRAPRGYRYIVIGGHVILVDRGYRVHDTIHVHIGL